MSLPPSVDTASPADPSAPAPAPLAQHLSGPIHDETAPLLVLSHGITDDARCWCDEIERWTAAGYRIVALDARGHGQSPRWDDADLTDQATAGARLSADLETVLEDLRANGPLGDGPLTAPLIAVGHSMGGVTTLDVAARRPDLVDAVVAEDPAFVTPAWTRLLRLTAYQRVRELKRVAADPEARVRRELEETPAWSRERALVSVEASLAADLRFMALGCVGPTTPWEQVVDSLAVPSLVVTGTDQVVLRGDHYLNLVHRANPRMSTAVIEGAPHCVRYRFPERFHAVVDPWMAFYAGAGRNRPSRLAP